MSISEEGRAASLPLIAGSLALDFANTSSGRGGERHLDHLRGGADIVVWACHAGLIDEQAGERLRQKIAAGDEGFAGFLQDAVSLREAIHRIASAVAGRRQPGEADLALLAARCSAALAKATIEMGVEGARWRWPAEPLAETILGPIALSAVGLLRDSDPARLKQCAGEHCGWVFFDMTKNRSRRWCEMSVCGNRAKAKAHYRRSKFQAVEVVAAAP